jgi:hypothetical protein
MRREPRSFIANQARLPVGAHRAESLDLNMTRSYDVAYPVRRGAVQHPHDETIGGTEREHGCGMVSPGHTATVLHDC